MGVAYNSRVVTDGLVLCLDAANPKSYPGSGTTWTDLSGNNINASLVNGPTYSSSGPENIVLDNADDSIQFTTNLTPVNNIGNSSSFTFSVTFRYNLPFPPRGPRICGLLQKGSYNPSYGINLAYLDGVDGFWTRATLRCGVRNLNGTPGVTQGYGSISFENAEATLEPEQWYRADMVHEFSGITHTITVYVNGISIGSQNWSDSLYPINFQNTSRISTNLDVISGELAKTNLNIASYSIYNRVLTASEIQQNFNATKSRYF
jgi:hypothetical protein